MTAATTVLSDVTPGQDTTDADGVLLRVRDLHTHFRVRGGLFARGHGEVRAVDGVSFDVAKGEILGLIGESGSGKTTLGRSILGLARPTSGSVWWRGIDLVALP